MHAGRMACKRQTTNGQLWLHPALATAGTGAWMQMLPAAASTNGRGLASACCTPPGCDIMKIYAIMPWCTSLRKERLYSAAVKYMQPCCSAVAARTFVAGSQIRSPAPAHHFSLAASLPRPQGSKPWSPGREPSRWAGKALPGNQWGRLAWAACWTDKAAGVAW